MPRPKRSDVAGCIYHALNRGNARSDIFLKDGDYEAFERILAEGLERYDVELLAYCLLPNHWHLLLYPNHGTYCSTPIMTVRWASSCVGSPPRTQCVTMRTTTVRVKGTFTKGVLRVFRSKTTIISSSFADMSSVTRCGLVWWGVRKIGVGDHSGGGCKRKNPSQNCCQPGQFLGSRIGSSE